ncbi:MULTISPECIES: hypothetical protein [Ruegeria]|uniref:Uncharacterized protein n=1 Tax=Ruegeria arenilitoris TaxID=1173585 RepID=A0A238L262_9RHOB|nr:MULTISPECIES: hypothetical protein [Ruegeria]MBY6084486.1 hypothetical protein [Ruegeria arenilitoris]UWR07745.1 hypothetical protein K3752_01920 [Ruegeria sp. B32]SMX49175.1 hypothetical protein RUA8715_03672 [Ruegeria arenilitoris]
MSTYVSKEISAELDAARIASLKKSSRLRVEMGDNTYRILKLWKDGFAVEAETTPRLRGLVDIFDGANHLYQCLIVADEEDGGQMRYEFKRSTVAADKAPLDFYRAPDAPIALLGKDD